RIYSPGTTTWPPTEPDFTDVDTIERSSNRLTRTLAQVAEQHVKMRPLSYPDAIHVAARALQDYKSIRSPLLELHLSLGSVAGGPWQGRCKQTKGAGVQLEGVITG